MCEIDGHLSLCRTRCSQFRLPFAFFSLCTLWTLLTSLARLRVQYNRSETDSETLRVRHPPLAGGHLYPGTCIDSSFPLGVPLGTWGP